jgi:hypothetical protein
MTEKNGRTFMQQNNDAHWNHKVAALALVALLTIFLAYGQYFGGWARLAGWGVRPAASAAGAK